MTEAMETCCILQLAQDPGLLKTLCRSYLDARSRAALLLSCKSLYKAVVDTKTIWEALQQRASSAGHSKQPTLLQFLQTTADWDDDKLFHATSVLLKQGAQLTDVKPSTVANGNSSVLKHEVAWLAERVCTRTLALLMKQRPASAELIKDYDTLRAGVRSNKEFIFLFLTARGAKFEPHLEQLTAEAIRSGASKSLLWLAQWPEEMTPQKLQTQLQTGLPDPEVTSCHDVAATMEVLLLHGLSANATVTCTSKGMAPTPEDPGQELSLLEWAVRYAVAAARVYERRQARLAAPAPPAEQAQDGQAYAFNRTSFDLSNPGSVPDLIASAERGQGRNGSGGGSTPAGAAAGAGSPRRGAGIKRQATDSADLLHGYGGTELLHVLLRHGAQVNARKGGALLAAAQGLRGDLVSELVSQGADVTLPRLPGGADLLRWAVDTKSCPSESGVLQALLQGVKASGCAAVPGPSQDSNGSAQTPRTPMASAAAFVGGAESASSVKAKAMGYRNGRKTEITPSSTPRASNGVEKLRSASSSGVAEPARVASPGPPAITSSVVPMVTVGGQGALSKAQQSEESKVDADSQESSSTAKTGSKGSLLPSTMVSELQRDAAFLEAVDRNDVQVVRTLLEAGADVHCRMDKAILLALGAIDNNSPDQFMPRPRDRAPMLSICKPMVELLLQYGADINARQGRAICQAGRWRDTYSIKYLLDKGADRSWLDKDPVVAQKKLDI